MDETFAIWEVWYESCEGNKRWVKVKTPIDCYGDQVIDELNSNYRGGCGDEPAEWIEANHISDNQEDDYSYDLTTL